MAMVSSAARVSSAYRSSSDSECAPDILTLLQDPAARRRNKGSIPETTQKQYSKRERKNKEQQREKMEVAEEAVAQA